MAIGAKTIHLKVCFDGLAASNARLGASGVSLSGTVYQLSQFLRYCRFCQCFENCQLDRMHPFVSIKSSKENKVFQQSMKPKHKLQWLLTRPDAASSYFTQLTQKALGIL